MDIRKILKEQVFAAPMAYRHLEPLQLNVLKKLASNSLNVDLVSDKVRDVIDSLVEYGLVTDYDYALTDEGKRVLDYATKLGGSVDKRQAGIMQQRKIDNPLSNYEIE